MDTKGSLQCSQKPSTGSILSEINPAHTTPFYLSKIYLNNYSLRPILISFSHLRLDLPTSFFLSAIPLT
jgi:hypothetical protein